MVRLTTDHAPVMNPSGSIAGACLGYKLDQGLRTRYARGTGERGRATDGGELSRTLLEINGGCAVYRPTGLHRLLRCIVVTAVIVLMIGTLSPAAHAANADESPSAGERANRAGAIAGDLLVVRPAGVMISLFGAALFLPTALLTATGGWNNVVEAYELLIEEPFRTTFQRPLGGP
jgi:hypothetical protein